jgi:hypothetical protein
MTPAVAGAGKLRVVACSFCDKMFVDIAAVRQHERMYHRKRLHKLLEHRP